MTNATRDISTSADVRDIQLEICHSNPWNKARPLDEAFLQSLREKGQIVIALVRPHPAQEGEYEVIFGDRRRRGLLEIGNSVLMAEVREMDDREAEELCAIENKQRAGLTWRQELEQIEEYLGRYPEQFGTIASALGISVNQVRRRHKLLGKLSKSWLKAIKANKFETWTVDHFESLMPFTDKQQETIYLNDFQYDDTFITVKDLRDQLARDTQSLKGAPWDLADATLCPSAGACTECPLRSGANTDLFDEVDPKVAGQDRCLDEECFGKKQTAFVARKVAELRKEEPEVLMVSNRGYQVPAGSLGSNDYQVVKATTKGAKKAVQVDGSGAGKVVYVKPAEDAKREAARAAGKPMRKSLAERRAELDKRRDALAIEKLIAYIEDENEELEFDWGADEVLTQYALAYGVEARCDRMNEAKRIRDFAKNPFKASELWDAVASHMQTELRGVANSLSAGEPAAKDETVMLCAWMVDADWSELRAAAAAELPDPKSWADEKEEKKPAGKKRAGKSKAAQDLEASLSADELRDEDEGEEGWDNIETDSE